MSKAELFHRLQALTTDFHTLACELDIGDERTEVFEIYEVLRGLSVAVQLVKCWLQLIRCLVLAFLMIWNGRISKTRIKTDAQQT